MKNLKKNFAVIAAATALFSACASGEQNALTVSGLDPVKFDTIINEKPVKLFTLKNQNGMEVCITNYGGRVVSLVVPDKDGKPTDVVLGYDNIQEYADTLNSPSDYGSSVGRYANRIKNSQFKLGDETYQLKVNDNENCLHGGGTTGWMNQVYTAEQIGDSILKLTIVAEDGENGFPGNVTATTIYKVCANNTLDITWEAETDKPTIINQTNHNYYNLSGDFTKPGYDMLLYVNADKFTASDATVKATTLRFVHRCILLKLVSSWRCLLTSLVCKYILVISRVLATRSTLPTSMVHTPSMSAFALKVRNIPTHPIILNGFSRL